MNTIKCPICEEKIKLNRKVSLLDRISCPTCDALLEVTNTNPVEVDWIYFDEEPEPNNSHRGKRTNFASCPLCRENVHIGSNMGVGHRLICPGCDAQLEIVSLIPLELDWPFGNDYDARYIDYDSFSESYND